MAVRGAGGGHVKLVGSEVAAPTAHTDAVAGTLELRGISKRWRRGTRPILDHVDLSVPGGTSVLLTGRNGVGKTTLLRVAAGVIAPESGSVSVRGLRPEHSRREFNRRICLLAAGDNGLYARLSVRRHLDLAGRLALQERAQRAASAERVIDAFKLEDVAASRVDRLSMGQRQRVRLAMAFLHDPELALLDEPSSSLDDDGVELLQHAVSRVLARGGAAIWCEPSADREAFSHDRRLVLEQGVLHAA